MPQDIAPSGLLRLAQLKRQTTAFDIVPDAAARTALANDLGLLDLRKLRLAGRITAEGGRDWLLTATLGATVVQPCVVTLDPVTTRIDETVTRRYSPDTPEPAQSDEVEIPEDDTLEPLPDVLDLNALLAEALALALPVWPRSAGAALGTTRAAPDGIRPLADEDTRPFAGLADLRDRLAGKTEDEDANKDEDTREG
ncbi:YceD family protein [Roseovarius autotrophicus]|uniref:YceD family protein n=1 Tax=Roseovarius autotrophicus TaxID=2824121 RepID=UPI0019EFF2B0|nr:YceD family protein [Roseovarius autotrophicus]MBE0452381.1 DUF177 domain-containing protein [Roseovarius sp.]